MRYLESAVQAGISTDYLKSEACTCRNYTQFEDDLIRATKEAQENK